MVTTTMLLFVGASTLLLIGPRGFTAKFKLAYILFSIGFAILGIALIQIPALLLTTADIAKHPWVMSGGILVPFITGAFMIYFGIRTYARLFGVRGIWRSATLATGISIAGGALITQLPHAPWYGQPETAFDSNVGIIMFLGTIMMMGAVVAFRAHRQATKLYSPSLLYLALGTAFSAASNFTQVSTALTVPNGLEFLSNTGIAMIPNMIAAIFLLRSAVALNTISSANEVSTAPASVAQLQSDRIALDAVIYLAGLASSTIGIETILNPVRSATAQLTPQQPIPLKDQQRFAQSYRELEDYLVNQEPVHRYPLTDLRKRLEHTFQERLTESAFWHNITLSKH
jgi:hypothetical protein